MHILNKKNGFTLVELIVVVTILGILSTIGFVSYSGYLIGVRDTNRTSNLKALADGLKLYSTKYILPLPDDYVEVKAKGEVIAYQGYAGKNILKTIDFSNGGLDPKDNIYYSYYLTRDRKSFQLMGFLEDKSNLELTGIFNNANAIDYSIRYPKVYGMGLGILTDETNTPIQEIQSIIGLGEIDLGNTNSGTVYSAHINDVKSYVFSGSILEAKLYTLSKPGIYEAPKGCPEGFVGVPGDSNFKQKGFCIAAYEMSYTSDTAPSAPDSVLEYGSDNKKWNTYKYDKTKKIASNRGRYPIAELTAEEAVEACKSMGRGYHLVTNNEWMAMARNVEMEKINWSTGKVGEGYISNGNSNDLAHGCTLNLNNITGRRRAAEVGFRPNNTCNEKRKLILSNGAVVRDIQGNLREWTNKANTLNGEGVGTSPESQTSFGTLTSDTQWENSDIGDYFRKEYGPIFGKNNSNAIGEVFHPAGTSNNAIARSGCAYCGNDDGIFGTALVYKYNTKHANIGFRCAYIR